MADRRIDIMEGVRAAWRFAPTAGPRAWAPLLLLTAAMIAVSAGPGLGLGLWVLPGVLVTLVLSAWAYGALFRIAFTGEAQHLAPTPGGLAWGRAENSALGATLLIALLVLLIIVAAAFAGLLVGSVIFGLSGGGRGLANSGPWLISLVPLALIVTATWLGLRLALSVPASVVSGSVQVFSTWALTKGQVLRLLAACIIVGAPALAIQGAAYGLALALGTGVDSRDPVMITVRVLTGLVAGLVQTPLTAGLYAYAYRTLRAPIA